jgi:allantoinase
MMSIGLHSRWIGQAGRASALRDFLEYAHEKGDVWFARRIDIANWWLEHHEEFER